MKIAYVVPMTWACGGILAPFYQANELVSRGHEVTIFAPRSDTVDWFPLRAPLLTFASGLGAGEEVRSHQSSCGDHFCDIVVFVGDTFRHLRLFHARKHFLLLQGKDHLMASSQDRRTLLRAYSDPRFHILAVSHWLADFVRDECANSRVSVIGNGVDLNRFFPDPKPREGFRILIEGNFPDPNKNVLDALEVASRVRQYQKLEVWALGKRFASPGSLVDKVFEDLPQDSIPGVYQQCDLLLKTSILEGFGLPHLEAMACGCVPATYASGGVTDFCRHEENSLVTGVGNLPLLVWHVLRFFSDPAFRQSLRVNAIATARSRSWTHVAGHLEEVFTRALDNSS